jgi:hypothetical protein
MLVDIMLFYVENCVRFTNDYGDINESFYSSACNMYAAVIKEINHGDAALYRVFAERLRTAAENACDGWAFRDNMIDMYYQIEWISS